jgi:hypothetical protein
MTYAPLCMQVGINPSPYLLERTHNQPACSPRSRQQAYNSSSSSSMSDTGLALQLFMSGDDDIIVKDGWKPQPGQPMPQMAGVFVGKQFGAGGCAFAAGNFDAPWWLWVLLPSVHAPKLSMCVCA